MEDGDEAMAGDEKHRLEQKQRAARKAREKAGATEINDWGHTPRWFKWVAPADPAAALADPAAAAVAVPEPEPEGGAGEPDPCAPRAPGGRWVFQGGYWEGKACGEFDSLPSFYCD